MRKYHPDHRMFVQLSSYVQQYIRCVYMQPEDRLRPIALPFLTHRAGRLMYERLRPNPEMKLMTRLCYTCNMFSATHGEWPDDVMESMSGIDRDKFCAFELPEPHWFAGRWITDDPWMQLSSSDTLVFTNILVEEFWTALDRYWAEYQVTKSKTEPGRTPYFSFALLDFMEDYQIDLDNDEAILKAHQRRNEKMKNR